MAGEKFKLPKSSYDELVKIIKGYNRFTQDAAPTEVSNVCALHRTVVSRNNGFLLAIGVIKGGNKKSLTDVGRDLAGALDHEMTEQIKGNWQKIVMNNDFLLKIVSAVRIRKSMENTNLISHIAYSAGQPKKKELMTGARAVIEILREAALLKEEDGQIIADIDGIAALEETKIPRGEKISDKYISKVELPSPEVKAKGTLLEQPSIAIQIQIQCNANDVDELVPKLKKLFKELLEFDIYKENND